MRHLLSATPGTTAVLLSGGSLRLIHDAAKVARAHQPAIVVLEDCDLVAEDRSFSMGASPLLFEVLDALDGLDADADVDVAFILTTNRVEDLEGTLAAPRPRRPRGGDPAARQGWSRAGPCSQRPSPTSHPPTSTWGSPSTVCCPTRSASLAASSASDRATPRSTSTASRWLPPGLPHRPGRTVSVFGYSPDDGTTHSG